LLLEQVTVTVEGNTDRVEIELRWAGGFTSRHTLTRPVQTYQQLSNYDELVARIESLQAERKTLAQIAAALNAEGFHPPKRVPRFNQGILSRFLREQSVRTGTRLREERDEQHLKKDEWWLADLAAKLAMPIATLHRWQRVGWVRSRKVIAMRGRWAIYADADEMHRLQRLRDSPRGWPQPYPTELITPKQEDDKTEDRQ
jgi:DNA-binding transcriptional MerR regulator